MGIYIYIYMYRDTHLMATTWSDDYRAKKTNSHQAVLTDIYIYIYMIYFYFRLIPNLNSSRVKKKQTIQLVN